MPEGKPINWLGVASLIAGLFALAFSWVPFLGCGAIPYAVLGLILGFVGLLTARRRQTGLGFPIAGMVVSLLALLVPVALLVLVASAPDPPAQPAPAATELAP